MEDRTIRGAYAAIIFKNGKHTSRESRCVNSRSFKILSDNIDTLRFQMLSVIDGSEIGIDYVEIDQRYFFAVFDRIKRHIKRQVGFAAAVMPAYERYPIHTVTALEPFLLLNIYK